MGKVLWWTIFISVWIVFAMVIYPLPALRYILAILLFSSVIIWRGLK